MDPWDECRQDAMESIMDEQITIAPTFSPWIRTEIDKIDKSLTLSSVCAKLLVIYPRDSIAKELLFPISL
jgi:hypothetical protein